jgi:hypothetical protein
MQEKESYHIFLQLNILDKYTLSDNTSDRCVIRTVEK